VYSCIKKNSSITAKIACQSCTAFGCLRSEAGLQDLVNVWLLLLLSALSGLGKMVGIALGLRHGLLGQAHFFIIACVKANRLKML